MAQVTLNTNSWHFKYYSTIVSETPPKTLCPYFWIMTLLIIMSPFFGVAFGLSFIAKNINNFFDSILPKSKKKERTMEEWEEYFREEDRKLLWCFKFIILPVILILVCYLVYQHKVGWFVILMTLAISLSFAALIFGFVYLVEKYGSFVGEKIWNVIKFVNPLRWKITLIIVEMIKVSYTKACPIITWEGKTKQDETI